MTAQIHDWCGRLDDPARRDRCPCRGRHDIAAVQTRLDAARRRARQAVSQ